jgi:F-type H+-transporting ATPase subunit beta
MAEVIEKPAEAGAAAETGGRVSQVIGAVVDVEFPPGRLPNLLDALVVKTQDGREVVLEVQQEVGDSTLR